VLARVAALPLAALLVTAVDVEGRMEGCDLDLYSRVLRSTGLPVIASGGITTIGDVRALAERGVASAVIGMALYTGTLDAADVAAHFSGVGAHERHLA
jgi:phosphoribosylformimino-5-aminoimidazole carboxamide ribotide isomerase